MLAMLVLVMLVLLVADEQRRTGHTHTHRAL